MLYVSAREFFAAVRDASIECERTRRTLERMESAEGLRAQTYQPRTTGGGSERSGMARVDARIDYESRMARRIEEDYALIDCACAVIYGGKSGEGGVEQVLGPAFADAMWWRYCAAGSWRTVADRVGHAESWCRQACEAACDAVDAYGLDRMAAGAGIAEG